MANFLKILGILLLATLPGRGEAASGCMDKVVVTGLASITHSPHWDIKTDYNGVYTIDSEVDGKPVYKHTPVASTGSFGGGNSFYLYYSKEQGKWKIDNHQSMTSAGFLSSEGDDACPYNGTKWKTYGGCNVAVEGQANQFSCDNIFQAEETLPVNESDKGQSSKECLDEVEVEVTGSASVLGIRTDYMGVYKIVPTVEGKPVYKHKTAKYYLYYASKQAKWKIDTDPNMMDSVGFVFSEGDTPCPYDGTNWKTYSGCIDDIYVTGETQGLVMLGGGGKIVAEFWSPTDESKSCQLPFTNLPENGVAIRMSGAIVNYLPDSKDIVTCFGTSCYKLTTKGWEKWGAKLSFLLHLRNAVTSHVTEKGILLLHDYHYKSYKGGTDYKCADGTDTKDVLPIIGANHCSIRINENKIVVIGGGNAYKQVTEYTIGLDGKMRYTRTLPSLNTGRIDHACGMYKDNGIKLIVTSGGRGQDTHSTEVFNYEKGSIGKWIKSDSRDDIPLKLGVRGVTIYNDFYITGYTGTDNWWDNVKNGKNVIYKWDGFSMSWVEMRSNDPNDGRRYEYLAMTTVPASAVAEFCLKE